MKDNETEFANQDEEISYKDMWEQLRFDMERLKEANRMEREELLERGSSRDYWHAMDCLKWENYAENTLQNMTDIEREWKERKNDR